MEEKEEHVLHLVNRECAELTGVSDVDSFNENEITAITSWGELLIKGELLHVEELNLDSGLLSVTGKINALVYSEKISKDESFFKRLFGG